MRLSNLLNIFMGRDVSPEEELGLEAASADMSLLMSHDGSEPSFIAGTSSQPVSYTHLTLPTTPYV